MKERGRQALGQIDRQMQKGVKRGGQNRENAFGAKEGGLGRASGVSAITTARGNMANIIPSTQEKISRYPSAVARSPNI